MKPFRVAATQLAVRHRDKEGNLALHARFIGDAAKAGCQLVVFPELSVTGHNGTPEITRDAEPLDGRIFHAMQEEARRHDVVVGYGFCELFRGTHYNAYALAGPGGLIGVQRKVHASFDEFFRFRQAYEWNVFDLGFCRAGIAICHDSDFFESWRILALKGAEAILLPHANRKMIGADGALTFDGSAWQAPEAKLLEAQRDLIAERPAIPRLHDVMARDNGVFAVFSDQVGFDGDSTHVGGAYILGPDGALLARNEPSIESQLITAHFDPAILTKVRENPVYPLLKRRPETYATLTEPL